MRDSISAPLGQLPALTEVQRLWRQLRWFGPVLVATGLLLTRPAIPGVAAVWVVVAGAVLVCAPPLVNLRTRPDTEATPAVPSRSQLLALVADAITVVSLVGLFTLADPRSDTFVLLLLPQLQMSTTRRLPLMAVTAVGCVAAFAGFGVLAAALHGVAPAWSTIGVRVAVLTLVALALAAVSRLLARHIRGLRSLHRSVVYQALHDGLTGLPNRALFFERARLALARQQRSGAPVAVLFFDLDDLKRVNDTMGHAAGDELLRVTAARLRDELRATDTPARLGGDEFAVLLDEPGNANVHDVTQRLLLRLSTPISTPTLQLRPSVSIGVAGSERVTSAEDLVERADRAMYRAKAAGKGRVVHFDGDLPTAAPTDRNGPG